VSADFTMKINDLFSSSHFMCNFLCKSQVF